MSGESLLQRWIQVTDPLIRDLFRVVIARLNALDINQETGAAIESVAASVTTVEADIDTLQDQVVALQSEDGDIDGRLDDIEDDMMVWKGTWSAATAYRINDVVGRSGATYVAILAGTNQDPVTATTYWTVLPGTDGSGSASVTLPRTQTVLSGPTNDSGKAEWLVAGTGLAIDVDTSGGAASVTIAFADGFDTNGPKSYVYTTSADEADVWTGLDASTSNYLYLDYDAGTGTLTGGQCAEPPLYTKIQPLAHYNQRATGGTVLSGGTASGNCFDVNHTVNTDWSSTQTGVGISGVAYIGYDFGAGVTRQITRVVYTNHTNAPYNLTSVVAEWSSDGATWTAISTHALDATPGATNVIPVSAYTAARYFRLLANANLAVGQAWHIEQLLFQSLEAGNHWFDPSSMKMQVWDGSAWSEQLRVFVGECVTDATSVTAVYSYAYNGDFDSGWLGFVPASPNNSQILEHALGVSLSQGVELDAFYSAFGDDMDAVPVTGMSHSSTFGFHYWPLTGSLTRYNETRMYLYVTFVGSQLYYGELKARGYYRIRMRRTW